MAPLCARPGRWCRALSRRRLKFRRYHCEPGEALHRILGSFRHLACCSLQQREQVVVGAVRLRRAANNLILVSRNPPIPRISPVPGKGYLPAPVTARETKEPQFPASVNSLQMRTSAAGIPRFSAVRPGLFACLYRSGARRPGTGRVWTRLPAAHMAAWPRPGSPNPPSPDPLPGPRAYHRHRRPVRRSVPPAHPPQDLVATAHLCLARSP